MWTFGPNNNYTVSKTGTTITKTIGLPFNSGDVGKIIYWNDGTTDTIDGFISPSQVSVSAAGTQASQNIYIKPNDRPIKTYSMLDARIFADFIYLDTVHKAIHVEKILFQYFNFLKVKI